MGFEIVANRRQGFGVFWIVLLVAALIAGLPSMATARYASIVMDADTGEVLHQTNADTRNYPASLTKMMTLYMAFEALEDGRLKMDQRLRVSRRAAGMSPSKLGLRRGQTIRVREAILALITKSANDAAVVVAEALGGSESRFARVMTKRARALGMTRTNFRNASGLPNRRQLSTARDLAMLARALIRDFPQYYDYFSTQTFKYRGRTYKNHNKLLKSYSGADGIKTGYTRASGYNLAASVERDGQRLIAVVLGGKSARSRDRHMVKLLDRGFANRRLIAKSPLYDPPPSKPASITLVPPPPRKPGEVAPPAGPDGQLVAARVEAVPLPPFKPESAAASDGSSFAEGPTFWGVQVGAFYNRQPAKLAADRAASRAPDLLSQTRVMTPSIKGRRGRIYRARLMGLTEAEARRACRRLEAARIDCLVVQDPDLKLALVQSADG